MASFVLMPDLRPGDRLLDRYRVLHPISRGGMGAVYEAEDERLGRRVAIKVLLGEGAQDGFKLERFRREARATAAVAHPSLVGIYDLHLEGDPPFIVMEVMRAANARAAAGGDVGRVGLVERQIALVAAGQHVQPRACVFVFFFSFLFSSSSNICLRSLKNKSTSRRGQSLTRHRPWKTCGSIST
jgi:hypothetical protein